MDIERTIDFIVDSQARAVVEMQELRASQRKTEETLRRAIRLAVQEARNERQKRRELDAGLTAAQQATDEKLKELAAAHLLTEEALRAYLRSLKPGGNGEH